MPIFLRESILVLHFFSFKSLKDIFTILRGAILSRYFIKALRAPSVNLLYDKFKFVVVPKYYIMLSKPASVKLFWQSFNPLIFLCFLTYFK